MEPSGGGGEWREELLGPHLVRCGQPDAALPAAGALGAAPVLGLYFAFADCGEFTRRLVELYRARPGGLELVQLLPPDAAAQAHLPWLALPPGDAEAGKRLMHTFGVTVGAPELVLLDEEGEEVSRPTAEQLLQPEDFPWRPRSVAEVLRGVALERCGAREQAPAPLTLADLPPSSTLAFYFAAQWCPPCKALSPQLGETCSLVRRRGHELRLVYVSSDRSEESYLRATQGMPWLSVPWARAAVREELARALRVQAIPALRMVPPGEESYEARAWAAGDPDGYNFPWRPSPVTVLCEYILPRLRDTPAVVLFVENEEREVEWARGVLQPAAEEFWEGGDGEGEAELLFVVAPEGGGATALRAAGGVRPQLAVLRPGAPPVAQPPPATSDAACALAAALLAEPPSHV